MVHNVYMQRCLDLAVNGAYTTSPNPMVGCVIVHNGEIIGEGWHKKAGEPHAEVNAIASVKDQTLLEKSTLYVSLEPCAHFGRTPPCASLIIQKNIPRVVVACLDPNPQVAGNGVAMLRNAGITVEIGVLEAQAIAINRKFITYHQQKRPFITLKWAQTADGFIDVIRNNGQKGSYAISGNLAKTWVHALRAKHDAILIGPQTARIDDPSLTVRAFSGKSPLRLIIDRNASLPTDLKVFTDGMPTIHFVQKKDTQQNRNNVLIDAPDFISGVIGYCYNHKIQSILVEGGAQILQAFINANLWDEAFVLVADKKLNVGLSAPKLSVIKEVSEQQLGVDLIKYYINNGLSGN